MDLVEVVSGDETLICSGYERNTKLISHCGAALVVVLFDVSIVS